MSLQDLFNDNKCHKGEPFSILSFSKIIYYGSRKKTALSPVLELLFVCGLITKKKVILQKQKQKQLNQSDP